MGREGRAPLTCVENGETRPRSSSEFRSSQYWSDKYRDESKCRWIPVGTGSQRLTKNRLIARTVSEGNPATLAEGGENYKREW